MRARFVGSLCLMWLVPLFLAAVITPVSLWYTMGVVVPFSYFAYRCFFSGAHKLVGAVSLAAYRVLYVGSLAMAAAIHLTLRVELAIAWYVSGAAFLFGEPIARDALVVLGFGTRYSADRNE